MSAPAHRARRVDPRAVDCLAAIVLGLAFILEASLAQGVPDRVATVLFAVPFVVPVAGATVAFADSGAVQDQALATQLRTLGGEVVRASERFAAGRLVLFPSYMWHGTVPFHDAASRTTIAFDAVPTL